VVPCIAARNDLKPILDVGATGKVEMTIWTTALEDDLWGNMFNRRHQDPAQNPSDEWLRRVEFVSSVTRTIEFMVHDAGRQMVGSFHPTERDFFEGVYRLRSQV